MKLSVIVLLCFFSSIFLTAQESQLVELRFDPVDQKRARKVPVKVYLTEGDGSKPVILYSHGLGGSRETKAYLGKHWANHNYIAVFMQHAGSDEQVWRSVPRSERMAAMKKAAGVQAALDRHADVPFVIDQLEIWNSVKDHLLYGKLDLERIGMCGHSFGAHSTQAMMGQKFPGGRSVEETRIDAFFCNEPVASQSHASGKVVWSYQVTGFADDRNQRRECHHA